MIKPLFMILLSLYTMYTTNGYASKAGSIGQIDNREYGDLSEQKYRGVAKLTLGSQKSGSLHTGECTGVFIAKNLILTNAHCAVRCDNFCVASFYNGEKMDSVNLSTLTYPSNYEDTDEDWAVLQTRTDISIDIPIAKNSSIGAIEYGGFGALRIIKDDEIHELKRLYTEDSEIIAQCEGKDKENGEYIECVSDAVDKELAKNDHRSESNERIKPLFDDDDKFKVQDCEITGYQYVGKREHLKTNCNTSSAYSGAPYLRSNRIVGLNDSHVAAAGLFDSDEDIHGARGIKTEDFYDEIQRIIAQYGHNEPALATNTTTEPNQTNINTSNNISGNNSTASNATPVTGQTPTTANSEPAQSPTKPANAGGTTEQPVLAANNSIENSGNDNNNTSVASTDAPSVSNQTTLAANTNTTGSTTTSASQDPSPALQRIFDKYECD